MSKERLIRELKKLAIGQKIDEMLLAGLQAYALQNGFLLANVTYNGPHITIGEVIEIVT